jgi:hypothetical protein
MSFNIRYIINILCIPVVLCGIHTCFQGAEIVKTANETYAWKTASGKIIYAGIQESSSTGKYKTVYRKPVIKYTYIANKRHYQGDTIYWGDDKRSINQVSYTDDVVAKYTKNKQIVVYYNPLDPQKSVLETGTSETTFTLLVFGGILIFIGSAIPLLFFVFRNASTGSMEFKSWK